LEETEMRKVLLAGTALVGLVAMAAPAHAELKTEIGGYFRGYGVYADNDETSTAAAGDSLHSFEFRRDNEIHFNGETTLDNGLTVGAHTEINLGGAAVAQDETYAYFSGGWGRVNFGAEDGAAYLLQVAAPSADSNVDGLRPYISGLNNTVWVGHAVAGVPAGTALELQSLTSYQHADFRMVDRLTYLSPKFNGFQAGVSYTPIAAKVAGIQGMSVDDAAAANDDLWEVAARWDGEFSGVGISAGAGYSSAATQTTVAAAPGAEFSDDLQTWNGGVNFTWSGFSLGGGYHWTNNGINAGAGASGDTDVWTVGLGWDNGPYHLGGNWLQGSADPGVRLLTGGANTGVDYNQYALGGGYTYGPGMTFRGAFKWGKVENKVAAATVTTDFSQATVGTDIQF
jgi:outer membrane protein OmpU